MASALFLLVVINWSWHLQPTRYTSDFYDVQARELFHGRLSVPLDRIGLEAFAHGDAYHLYFGLFPTILRMPLLLVTDRFDGRLTQPSMLLAFVVMLIALRGLCGHARVLIRGDWATRPPERSDRVIFAVVPLLCAAATPVLFLSSVTAVYHEAILWGLAASLYAFHRLLIVLARPTTRDIATFGAAATVAMSARAAVGLAPCAAAGVLAIVALVHRRFAPTTDHDTVSQAFAEMGTAAAPVGGRPSGMARMRTPMAHLAQRLGADVLPATMAVGLAVASILPFATHVVVNEARFGTALSPPYASQVWTEMSAERRAALEANDGSLFNIGYIPSTAAAYLRPDGVELSRQFPYVWFDPPATVIGDVVFDTRDRTASLTAVSPALIIASLVGAGAISAAFVRRRRIARFALLVGTSIASTFGVLTIGFIAQRYEGDLLLPAALMAIPGLFVAADWLADQSTRWRRGLLGFGGALLVISLWANLSIAWLYQRIYIPVHESDRHAFIDLQLFMDRLVPGSISYLGSTQQPIDLAPAGTLHVRGDCEALSWSDGTIWIEVEPRPSGATPLCDQLQDRAS